MHVTIEPLCICPTDILWPDHGILNTGVRLERWGSGIDVNGPEKAKAVGLRARRPIRRPFLTPRHMQERLTWSRMRARWNLRSWRRIHWLDESRFLLHMVDGRIRVWRYPNTRYAPQNIATTVPGDGGSVMVWCCISYDCRLDLITIPGTLNAQRYQENVLEPHVVPHLRIIRLLADPISWTTHRIVPGLLRIIYKPLP